MEELMTDEELEIYLESGFLHPSRFKPDTASALPSSDRGDAYHEMESSSSRDAAATSHG